MNYSRPLLLLLFLFCASTLFGFQDKRQSNRQARGANETPFQSIRSLAERSEGEDAAASAKIDQIITEVNDPRVLFDLTVRLRERELVMGREHYGVCNICLCYFGAYISAMHTLSELDTDEAAQHLVRLMTVENCEWQGMPMKELLYNISLMGKRTLPYLEALRGKHAHAETIIEVVRKGQIFW